METKIKMIFLRSTKNTHVYTASESGVAIDTVYIKRDKLPTPAPLNIHLTLSYES